VIAPRPAPPADAVSGFLTSFWARHPVTATFAGVTGHDRSWPDWSPAALDASVAALEAERTALQADLAHAERALGHVAWPASAPLVDLRLADVTLEIEAAERRGVHFHRGNPALATGEAAFGLIGLMLRHDRPLEERWSFLAARLATLPGFLAGARRAITRAIPAAWRDRALRECEGLRILIAEGLPLWFGEAEGGARAATQAATGPALEAVAAYADWLRGEALVDADNDVAYGAERFAQLVRRGHWSSRSVAEWHAAVRERFAQARGQLASMAAALAPGGWAEVEARLATDLPDANDYPDALTRCWEACRALSEERRLVTWPDAPLRFAPQAPWVRAAAPYLYYLPYRCPAPLVSDQVHTHEVAPLVVEPNGRRHVPASMTQAQVKLNHVVHHAALGHHVQNHYAARSASRVGRVAAVDGASRIAMFVGGSLAEGWACYATDLMDEAGFLTPAERVAEQHTRVRLLARALMDIELHTGQRSLAGVAQFYALEVGMGNAAAHAEAVKNSMFPGAAIMYWLGLDGMHVMRHEAAERAARAGQPFALHDFHMAVLAMGAIPVPMIAERLVAGTA
jgi:hypothetical protein